jgi:hypothetical protein
MGPGCVIAAGAWTWGLAVAPYVLGVGGVMDYACPSCVQLNYCPGHFYKETSVIRLSFRRLCDSSSNALTGLGQQHSNTAECGGMVDWAGLSCSVATVHFCLQMLCVCRSFQKDGAISRGHCEAFTCLLQLVDQGQCQPMHRLHSFL